MEFKDILKIIKDLEKSTPEKILELRTIVNNNDISYNKQEKSMQEWIQNAPEKITESLQKLYKISPETDVKQEILKKHTKENIEKIFSICTQEETEITKIMNRKNFNKTSITTTSTLIKLCLLGVCFKVENKEEETYIIPQEIKEIWKNKKEENHIIRERIEEIVNMCGVIPKEEVWKIYQEVFKTNLTKKEFYIYVEATKNISQYFYDYEDFYILYKIDKKQAKKFIQIQNQTTFDEEQKFIKEILDKYQKDSIAVSTIGWELLEYVQTLKTDVNINFALEITDILREQTEFDPVEILEKVTEYIPALSKYTKTRIMTEIIRMYHDTRLYKFKGYKPFEINQYLSDKEIKQIGEKLEIEFENLDYLRLVDRYPEYLYGENGEVKQIYNEEDGTLKEIKSYWFEESKIRKNKKFDTYVQEKSQRQLEKFCESYKANNIDVDIGINRYSIIEFIQKNKTEIIQSNLITLSQTEIRLLKEIIKEGGYIEEKQEEDITQRQEDIYSLIDMGLLFTRQIKKGYTSILQLHIPKDATQIIIEFLDKNPINKILNLRKLLEGIAVAYGVIEKQEVREIIKKIKPDMLQLFDQYADIINYRGDDYSIVYTNINKKNGDTNKILMLDMIGHEDMKRILNQEGEYKKFTYEEYLKLGEGTYERGLNAYKKLDKYLMEYFESHAEDYEYFIDTYIMQQQLDKRKAMIYLRKEIENIYNVPDFIKQKIYSELIDKIVKIAEQMPQWNLKGNSIKTEIQKQEKKVEIGRNDPCPCGSGKKYKKCCGK